MTDQVVRIPCGHKLCLIDLSEYLKYCTYGLSVKTDKNGYESVIFSSGKLRGYSLARAILGLKVGDPYIADHRDRNTFNNSKVNLRIASPLESVLNRGTWGRSSYRGVYKNGRHWAASIMIDGKKNFLGTFHSERLALEARMQAEIKFNRQETK